MNGQRHAPAMSRFCSRISVLVALFTSLGFAAAAAGVDTSRAKRLLLIGQGPDGHPAASHEFMAGNRVKGKLFAPAPGPLKTVVQDNAPRAGSPALNDHGGRGVLFFP